MTTALKPATCHGNRMKAKKAKLTAKQLKQMESTNAALFVEAREVSSVLGHERSGFEPLARMAVPSVQEARQCIIRMKTRLGISAVNLGSLLAIPRNNIARWYAGSAKPPICARLLLPRLERELIPQDPTDPAQDTPTGSVQPAPDVIATSKPGHQA